MRLLGDVLEGRAATAPACMEGKALCVERIVRQEVGLLPLHRAALPAGDAPHLEFEINAGVAARQVAHPPAFAVVPARMRFTAGATDCFFTRRLRVMTRAFGSPKTPRTVGSGWKPGNLYDSDSNRLGLSAGMGRSCQNSATRHRCSTPGITGSNCISGPVFTHTITRRAN